MCPSLSQLAGRDERRSSTNRRALQVGRFSSKSYFDVFAGLSGTTAVIFLLAILSVPQVASRIGEG